MSRSRPQILVLLVLLLSLLTSQESKAQGDHSKEALSKDVTTTACVLISEASRLHGLPKGVLESIAKAESGLKSKNGLVPWPWTINVAGKGYHFRNREGALRFIHALMKRRINSFDIGCMQINWRWHGKRFKEPEALLDARTNIFYAARHLKELRIEHGTWKKAIAHYHSRDEERGRRYLKTVMSMM